MGNDGSRPAGAPAQDASGNGAVLEAISLPTKDEPKTRPVTRSPAGSTTQAPDSLPADPDKFEVVACKVDEMKIGEMKHLSVPGAKQQILVGRGYDGKHFAMGTACTHYNALLKNGVMGTKRIRCPWHGACYNTETGDIEEFPCNDGVHIFQVDTKGSDVIVKGNPKNVDDQRRVFPMTKWNREANQKTVVIIGGGPAGLICAETLRREKFDGQIVILTEESNLPYDRPKLSKTPDATVDKILLRKEEFLTRHDIDVRRHVKVTGVNVENKTVLSGNECVDGLKYDYLVIATGQRVRTLSIADTRVDWKNIHYLRTLEDANAIATAGKQKNVVILGSSFIGMECAAYFADKAATVTVISRTRVPFFHAFGADVGEAIKTELFDKKGVKFLAEIEGITEYIGDESTAQLKTVRLSDGTTVDLDILIVGIGSIPNTEFLEGTDLKLNPRNGTVMVDEFMATNIPDVYGAGDVTEFPLKMYGPDLRVTIGHWNIAHSLGRTAAQSIVGKKIPIHSVPYFWTQAFGKSFRFAGFGWQFDDVFVHGSLAGMKFVAYYLKADKVVAASSLMYDPVVSRFAELIAKGAVITRDTIKEDPELTKMAERIFTAAA